MIASCGGDKSIRLWTKVKGKWVSNEIHDAHDRTIRRLAFSPDGKYLAAAAFDSTCSIWEEDQGTFRRVATLEGHENEVKCVAFDSSGALIATCSRDKSVWIWEMESDKEFECVAVCTGHTQDVKAVAWHPSQEMLVSASYDDTIKIWTNSEDDWDCTETLSGHTSTIWDIGFDSTGNNLASVSDDKSIIVWTMDKREDAAMEVEGESKGQWRNFQVIPNAHHRTIYAVDWSANNVIATGSADNCIKIWVQDPSNQFKNQITVSLAHGKQDINSVAWNPKYPNVLVSAADDTTLKIWSYETPL
eukprot:TRINITY_DN7252_c0_g1_i1.p1 TRINITY_DN7252_c0_g1~~TRINITY_DN7252_c0_g1_i1.p1  ORF type:complete len:339 (+),score=47.54 TRINITY_DN7252_c0_g1_i1:109-1017(+)